MKKRKNKIVRRRSAAAQRGSKKSLVVEKLKKIPVLFDADVVVAGSGLCSTFAAIAAARLGARTVVIDRFGQLGGHIGPGLIIADSLDTQCDESVPGGLAGIAREFIDKVHALRTPGHEPYLLPEDAQACSYVAHAMLKEAGAQFLLSSYVGDPIMEGKTVKGVFVETRAGRVAVKAKVTIDGTGQADLARRAGAKMVPFLPIRPQYKDRIREAQMDPRWPKLYNDTQIHVMVADVDWPRYQEFCKQEIELTSEEIAWSKEDFVDKWPKPVIRALYKAHLDHGYSRCERTIPGLRASAGTFRQAAAGTVFTLVTAVGAMDLHDAKQISLLEAALYDLAYNAVTIHRKYIPGWEKAYMIKVSPYLGARGGPHIKGEYTLTIEDVFEGTKFDDVLYRNTHEGAFHNGEKSGFDAPYRMLLPKDIDGLLVCGRGAAYERRGHDPTSMRHRPSMMVFGQCVGTAAAIAANDGVTPKKVDIKKVQRRLVADGLFLGESERLAKLGIAK